MVGHPLVQIHVPKTGGTTVFETLVAAMGSDGTWRVTTEPISSDLIAERSAGLRLIGGHLTWATVRAIPVPCRVLTVIRDPVERVLSTYGYLRENADAGIFSPETAAGARETKSRSLSELILDRDSGLRSLFGPVQVGYLSSVTQGLRLDTAELMPDGDLDMPLVDRALASALHNLDTCWWVGTTETLDRDLRSLGRLLGREPFSPVGPQNPTRDRPDRSILTAAARVELDRLVAADQALHERAKQLADALAS